MDADADAAPTTPSVPIAGFLALSVISGAAIGIAKIVTQLFAIDLGASPFQIGSISAAESIGMMALTVPAGFIVARHGARTVYAIASLGPLLLNLAAPLLGTWWLLAATRLLIGLCIPFRTVSMNSAFLNQLKVIGYHRAGWYRAAFTLGVALLGPAVATALTRRLSYVWCYGVIAALFAFMAFFSLSFFPAPAGDADRAGVETNGPSVFAQVAGLLGRPEIAESCLLELLNGATVALFMTFVLLVVGRLPGLTPQDGISVLIVEGLVTITCLFFGARALRRLDRGSAYGVSLVLAVVALTTGGLAKGLPGLTASAVLLSITSAIVHLKNMEVLARLPGDKSKVAGVYQLAQMLGASVGALGGGALGSVTGSIQGVFLWWIPVLLLAAFPVLALSRKVVLDPA